MDYIDNELQELEQAYTPYPGAVAGTTLNRVMMDVKLLDKHGVPKTTDRESQLVWCLALGAMIDKKSFFYGNTIVEVVTKAKQKGCATCKGSGTIEVHDSFEPDDEGWNEESCPDCEQYR